MFVYSKRSFVQSLSEWYNLPVQRQGFQRLFNNLFTGMKKEIVQLPFDVALLPVTPLKAGDLTCFYENGNLRSIKCGEIEIVRMIYAAVRDKEWRTAPYTIENEKLQVHTNGFDISYTAIYNLDEIAYKSNIT